MKTKMLRLFVLGFFVLMFLMSGVSADISFISDTITQEITHGQTSTTINFQVKNTETSPVSVTFSETVSPTTGSWNLPSSTTIADETTKSFSATLSNIPSNFVGAITSTITVENTTSLSADLSVTINVIAPQDILDCQAIDNPASLKIKNIDFNNDGFSGREFGSDDEWFFMDEIEVEVEVENDGNWDVDDISLEWGLYDIGKKDWVIDIDEEDEFNLKDGDEETLLINFKLDDDLDLDFDEIEGDYRFYVIATGTIDDNDAGVDDGEDTCVFDFEDAEAIIEDNFVVLDNIEFPESTQCGETITVTADVWNIGSDQQDDVSVFIKNTELDIRKDISVGDIDEFDRQQISFTLTVPEDAEEKIYAVEFEVYDEDSDIFETDFDEDLAEFTVPFKVEGNCGATGDIIISASLESEAKAGKEMIIRATIRNNGDELETFTVNAAEFSTWASLISQDQNTLILNAGESRDVLFTFDLKDDTSGSQMFYIELISGDDVIKQPVSVNIEESKPFLGITGFAVENASLWGLGLLNLILVIIIIIIAVKIARKR